MTKAELVSQIASDAGLSKVQAEAALNAFMDNVTQALSRHEKVTLVGFGTFSVSHREARVGRDPRTGNPIDIPAAFSPKFKPGKNLKDGINL